MRTSSRARSPFVGLIMSLVGSGLVGQSGGRVTGYRAGTTVQASNPWRVDARPILRLSFGAVGHTLPRDLAYSMVTLSSRAPDHRWEGLVIGAAVLGASGVVLGAHFCQVSDSANKHCFRSAVSLGLLGVFGGGIIGGLIGGSIPKVAPD